MEFDVDHRDSGGKPKQVRGSTTKRDASVRIVCFTRLKAHPDDYGFIDDTCEDESSMHRPRLKNRLLPGLVDSLPRTACSACDEVWRRWGVLGRSLHPDQRSMAYRD